MKVFLVLAAFILVSCGSDDSSNSKEASTDLKPRLWDPEDYDAHYYGCVDDVMNAGFIESDSNLYCTCGLSYMAKTYEYDVFVANELEIVTDIEKDKITECREKYLQ